MTRLVRPRASLGLLHPFRPSTAVRASSSSPPSPASIHDILVDKPAAAMAQFKPSRIRNFGIIAHIDHGKSTLADRLLELTRNVKRIGAESAQLLDSLQVERERGITVKAQSASMLYHLADEAEPYLLNLIDTPGHVDFSYEVVKSLAACDGALLLVDASQGIQAQTLATYHAAKEAGLPAIPVLTKIDLPHADVDDVTLQVALTLGLEPEDVLATSAKSGVGIESVLPAVVRRVPPPNGAAPPAPCRARVVDSWYDEHRGVICLVQVVDGVLREQDRITTCLLEGSETFTVQDLGVLTPVMVRTRELHRGQVGYMVSGMRSTRQALLGDTVVLTSAGSAAGIPPPLPGYEPARPMLYASMFPVDSGNFNSLKTAVDKLTLNDSSVTVEIESSNALGNGLKCGFLGLLHMEVFHQRLTDEFDVPVIATTPQVPYVVVDHKARTRHTITSLADWPEHAGERTSPLEIFEPMVTATVLAPAEHLGSLLDELRSRRGDQQTLTYLEDGRVLLRYELPWAEVAVDLHDKIQTMTSGYASFSYVESDPRPARVVKVDLAINNEVVDALSFVCFHENAPAMGRRLAQRLEKVIDRQQFEIIIQAKVRSKVLARARVAPYRKDVLIKSGKVVGGGDVTRKRKLLEKQKKGKARAKSVGKVQLNQKAFWAVMER